jgi:aspartate kinase
VPRGDVPLTLQVLEQQRVTLGYSQQHVEENIAKISVVGLGMRSHAGVAATMFTTLAAKGINIKAISTSEIKISVLIDAEYTELALRTLHTAYGLDS